MGIGGALATLLLLISANVADDVTHLDITEITDLPDDTTEIDLGSAGVTDITLKQLARLKQLQKLDLRDTQISDTGLKHLKPLEQLRVLDLSRTAVTDAGLKELAPLRQITELNLDYTRV